MKKTSLLILLFSLSFSAQTDARLYDIINNVSAERIKSDIKTLTEFGTRNTFSDTISNTHGIGAARRWIKSEFEKISENCGNCINTFYQKDFVTKKGNRRVPHDAWVVNVVAIQKGTKYPNKYIIMSGDIDSRASDTMDFTTDAPGANDNASGMAGTIEAARVLSKYKFENSIIYVGLSGEEQGLFGSGHVVAEAVKAGSIDYIKYMMNLDMAGKPVGMNAGGQLNDENFFKELGATIQQQDSIFKNTFSNRSGLHSDHQPFMLEGVPILSVHSNLDRSIYGCYHSDCDDFDLVNEDHITNTARFGTMILYGLANADTLPATKMDSETTKEFMIKNNLKEKLIIGGDWKWEE